MKIKHYTFFSDSHRICLKYFLNTFPFEDNIDLTIRHIPQECESAEYESDGFDKSMIRKVEFINQSFCELDDNDILIFTDVDVIFLKPYKDLFLKELGDSDIIFQSDTGTVCMGVFCCRVSNKTRFFFKELLDLLNKDASTLKKFKHDQQAANLMLTSKNYNLDVKLFSHKVFNCGFLGKLYKGEDEVKFPNDMVLLHANFTIGLDNKIKLIKMALDQLK